MSHAPTPPPSPGTGAPSTPGSTTTTAVVTPGGTTTTTTVVADDSKTQRDLRKLSGIILGCVVLILGAQVVIGIINLGKDCWDLINYAGFFVQMMCILLIGGGYAFIQKANSPKDSNLDFFGGLGLAMVLIGGIGLTLIWMPNGVQNDWVKAGRIFRQNENGPPAPKVLITQTGLEVEAPALGQDPREVKEWYVTLKFSGGTGKKAVPLPEGVKEGEVFYSPGVGQPESKATKFLRP